MTNQESKVFEYIKNNQPVSVSDPKFTLEIGIAKNQLSAVISRLNKKGLLSVKKKTTGSGMSKSIKYLWSTFNAETAGE